jgi:flavorubredoxin
MKFPMEYIASTLQLCLKMGTSFSFNQYLITDDEPLLFHTGPRKMFPLVRETVASVLPIEHLRYIGFSHVEAMVSVEDLADRSPRALADGEAITLGKHRVRWFDAAHLPHAWDCGFLTEQLTKTFLCGDLFTQGGADLPPVTESDILGPSEDFRQRMDYFSYTKNTHSILERLASTEPTTLACMHGSTWSGDGAKLLRNLADSLIS